jgi:capsid protein
MRRKSKILDQSGDPMMMPVDRKSIEANWDVLTKRNDTDQWNGVRRLAANSEETRNTRQSLRDMARYELLNNPHLRGLITKIANEAVGRGPRISIEPRTSSESSLRAAAKLEELWREYATEVKFTEKLRLMITERPTGGESFTCWYHNPNLKTVPIGVAVYEGDQFESEVWDDWSAKRGENDGAVDGIHYDSYGNVTGYDRLPFHPYANTGWESNSPEFVDASTCFHWFRKDRPSQHRGVSEVAPMLQIYAHMRRFIESKVGQEELRAKLMGAINTGFSPDSGCADLGDEPIDMLIGDGQFTTLPDGWQVDMFNFPVTGAGIAEFMRTCLAWATQALVVPWNIAAGDSSDYNFASGRLDFISFYNYIDIIRDELDQFLTRFFKEWIEFAKLNRSMPSGLGNFKSVWRWDKREVIDVAKQANADTKLYEANLLDMSDYAGRQGYSQQEFAERQIRDEVMRIKLRQDIMKEMGVTDPMAEKPKSEEPAKPKEQEQPDDQAIQKK